MVGSMITMLLDGLDDDLKSPLNGVTGCPQSPARRSRASVHQVAVNRLFLVLSGGGAKENG
jgi:Mn-containing catalase